MAKKICITGVYGLLGQNLVKAFSGRGYNVTGIDLLKEPASQNGLNEYFSADITNKESIISLIKRINPDVLINTAAVTNVDLCETERDLAKTVNADSVKYMLEGIGADCKFVQISTDYVFDGIDGPYDEDAQVNPISWYGATKRMAEEAVLTYCTNGLIVRTMVLVGQIKGLKTDFIHFVKTSLQSGKAIKIVTDQVGNVTLASNLAKNIVTLIETGTNGIVSIAGSERISRFDFALKVAERYHLDGKLISSILTEDLKQPAKRPLSSGFTHKRAILIDGVRLLSIDQMMAEYDNE
jgi:dTDP-4-dehydrorhamnose reductase